MCEVFAYKVFLGVDGEVRKDSACLSDCFPCIYSNLHLSMADNVYYSVADPTKGFMLTASVHSWALNSLLAPLT